MENLKKVIILADYFPPCNLTPAERIFSFASYLHEFGYYPIVVTRNWEIPITHSRDEHKRAGTAVIHEKKNNFEIYYVPFKPTLKNKFFEKFYGKSFYFLYLIIAFFYTLGENFSTSLFTPYLPLYKQCKKLLNENKDINYLIISAGPFHLFKFGYLLKKQFNIKWIADYRDDWNTSSLIQESFSKKLLKKISIYYEKKWVRTASFFTSVSSFYVKKIHSLLNSINGYIIYNGYIESNYQNENNKIPDQFIIAYVGSLYYTQPVEIFLSAYKDFVDKNQRSINSKVIFVGLKANPPLLFKVQKQVQGYESYFEYTDRVPKKIAIDIQSHSTVLLAISHTSQKGIPGSKLYEYLALKKPVLICPSDNDIIEETLKSTNQAIIANDVDECANQLERLYKEFLRHGKVNIKVNEIIINQYTRRAQVGKLASLMESEDNFKL